VSTVNGWTAEQWTAEVKAVRAAMRSLGVIVPACLPGEPGDCGTPLVDHYVTYLALLKARVVVMAQSNLTDAEESAFTEQAKTFLDQYENEGFGEAGGFGVRPAGGEQGPAGS
jgi:hypothetical protein